MLVTDGSLETNRSHAEEGRVVCNVQCRALMCSVVKVLRILGCQPSVLLAQRDTCPTALQSALLNERFQFALSGGGFVPQTQVLLWIQSFFNQTLYQLKRSQGLKLQHFFSVPSDLENISSICSVDRVVANFKILVLICF